jgi:hypothetical protein
MSHNIVVLDAAREAKHGECAGLLPHLTTVTMTEGVPAIGIDSNQGISVIRRP